MKLFEKRKIFSNISIHYLDFDSILNIFEKNLIVHS